MVKLEIDNKALIKKGSGKVLPQARRQGQWNENWKSLIRKKQKENKGIKGNKELKGKRIKI